jgi:hypothetical protein
MAGIELPRMLQGICMFFILASIPSTPDIILSISPITFLFFAPGNPAMSF